MYTFALQEIDEIKGRLKIFKLLVNGTCEYDEFEKEIETDGNLKSELIIIETRLFEIADLKSLPQTKFKDITPKKASNKEYEIKTHHLRVYLFHDKNTGRIIVCGGKKGSQKADIKHFRNIKKEYFNQKP
jgi:putative component of toxin-antitoxin plasmid stabilization module